MLGPYQVVSALGAGGMGEVYRAHDPRLHRDVAIKILSRALADDGERLQRFRREAQTLAALNHPHIAQIYGFEEAAAGADPPIHALVMELVEGEDLSARIARGALPLDEATDIARQIADALEAAHEQGVVHRDLKPANVKVRADGAVKVLDFGLAKAIDAGSSSTASLVNSPTITSPGVTAAGVILGTAAYMSPEQARGKPVDKRADIWAFGVVLYEMLTGRAAFAGETVTDMIAAVVTRDPDWSAVPDHVPLAIRQLLRRCLEKDPRVRLRDIGEARVALQSPSTSDRTPSAVVVAPLAAPAARVRRVLPWASAILLSIAAGLGAWLLKPAPAAPVRKLELSLPAEGRGFTLSPDGRQIAYFERGRLWLNDLERLEVRDLAAAPLSQRNILFWSRDSAFIGFNAADGKIWVVPSGGGTPLLVCTIPETRQLMGAAWGTDDAIVFAVWRGSLYRVPARGGEPALLAAIDPAKEIDFHEVVALPGGRVVTTAHLMPAPPPAGASPTTSRAGESHRVEIISADRRETIFGTGFVPAAYDPRGYLLLNRSDANQGLWAVPFTGTGPLRVEDGFLVAAGSGFPMSAEAGTLLYPLTASGPQSRELVWVDRTGRVTGQIGTAQTDLSFPALSPDGQRVAFSARTADNLDIWIRDVARGTQSRLTFEAGDEVVPMWFPGGRRVGYVESGGGVPGLRLAARNADGSGARTELGLGFGAPLVSRDGRFVVFHVDERGLRVRYAAVAADGTLSAAARVFKSDPEPIVVASSLSPDGRYLAYVERQTSGLPELFVTAFPSGEGRWQISAGGGRAPEWAATGELFFVAGATDGPKQMAAVPMTLGATLGAGTPVKLFDIPDDLSSSAQAADYDVGSDAKQLVMVRRRSAGNQATVRWILVQNWLSEFRR